MTGAAAVLAEHVAQVIATAAEREHLCDLCPRQRPGLPRRMGTRTVDYWWACQECAVWWLVRLEMEGRL